MAERTMRFVLYAVLLVLAFVFLMPVYVMVINSLKPLEEIRSGNLMTLPIDWTLDPWRAAWSTAQIGVQPTGLKPYFINSFLLVVPAVAISTLIGALNGYILTQYRIRGAHLLVKRGTVVRPGGDADRRTDRHLLIGELEGPGEFQQDALADPLGSDAVRKSGHEQRELVTREPPYQRRIAGLRRPQLLDEPAEPRRDHAEQHVSLGVPQRIVD